jgi:hypothetical protein
MWLAVRNVRCAPVMVSSRWPLMREWLAVAAEHLNRWEAPAVAPSALPADPPAPAVAVLTTLEGCGWPLPPWCPLGQAWPAAPAGTACWR